jgi:hypothetical protein
MRRIFVLICIAFCFATVFHCAAQEFEVPQNYKLEKPEDYVKYEADVLKCIDYLENIPLDDESARTIAANAFLLKWIEGSPNVTIELNAYVVELCDKNKEFIMLFMGGWTRYALQNPDSVNSLNGNMAGLESIIKVYKQGQGVSRDKKVEKIIQLQAEGKLEDWLKEQIKKNN